MNIFFKLYMKLDHSECNVANGKRLFAYIIDWFLGSLCTLLPMCLLWMMWTKDMDTMASVNVLVIAGKLGDMKAYLAGTLSILFALFYYVYIPLKIYPGQTPGKRAMGFKIVKKDDSKADLKTLLIREVIGVMIIEGSLYTVSGVWHSMLSLALNLNLVGILMYAGLAVGILSGFMILKINSRRMFHDYLANTKVVEYEEYMGENKSI